MSAGRPSRTLDELRAEVEAARAADPGLCGAYVPAPGLADVPPGMDVHGPLCGCGPAAGWAEGDRTLCASCGRHEGAHGARRRP